MMRRGGGLRMCCAVLVAAALCGSGEAAASSRHPSWHQPVAAAPVATAPGGIPVAVGARVEASGGTTRLVVDLGAGVAIVPVLTEAPDRLIIDMPEVNFQVDPVAGHLPAGGTGLIRAFRFGLFAPGRSRIVADLAGPAAIRRAEVASIAGGAASRFTVELAPTDRAAFRAAVRPPQPAPPRPDDRAASTARDARPVIVLDPGHGGLDPGATGLGGVLEKDVVLRFAAALAARLEAGGRYRVVSTRTGDSFVSLGDRVRVARDADAALFISVHADSLSDGSVAGATVYTASDRASDGEAARVAATENEADAAAGVDEAPKAADVSDILFDLTRRETRTYAHQFQRTLTGYWAKVARLNRNPERAAGFKVLQAPDVPSVLLELGYLSSGQDARAMDSPEWRARTVDGVAGAVDAFFADRGGPAGASPASAQTHAPTMAPTQAPTPAPSPAPGPAAMR
ncbi:N-acetylmuramoyl-L-alanine amidase [Lichenibacterium ramalinae]|nr:N-acetylmuramoyl-L-alanine amidase [Lichenibacterium ramalinae]